MNTLTEDTLMLMVSEREPASRILKAMAKLNQPNIIMDLFTVLGKMFGKVVKSPGLNLITGKQSLE
jgi:hypothetical protein